MSSDTSAIEAVISDDAVSNPSTGRRAPQSLRAVWPAMLGLSAVFLVEMLDNSLLNVALPTIGRELGASASTLQWVVGGYAVVFGGLMLLFAALADKFGRRRLMMIGLTLLGLASLATVFVETSGQLIAVRVVMGIAAAMTAPGTMALAFRLFDADNLRMRATAVISTVGLVGLAIGPTVGGLVLAVAPWQALLVINAPIALVSAIAIRRGIEADRPEELHKAPLDFRGAILGTLTIAAALIAPTLFIELGVGSLLPWVAAVAAVLFGLGFIQRERTTDHPLIDLQLLKLPRVSGGLAYEIAMGLVMAGLGYTVMLQLQLAWGWSAALAAVAMLPQVITLIAMGPFVEKIVDRLGAGRAATYGMVAALSGLVIYGLLGRYSYAWIAVALVLVSAGMRVVTLIAALNVMGGLPEERTQTGAALSDTAGEVSNGVGVAISGTVIAAIFAGSITADHWTTAQAGQFQSAVTIASLVLAGIAAALVLWGRSRMGRGGTLSLNQPAES